MHPSGRFDALVDMGNPLKGIVIFPFLSRRKEGRAMRAVGPAALVEISRTAGEKNTAWRWPRDLVLIIRFHLDLFFSFFYSQLFCSMSVD